MAHCAQMFLAKDAVTLLHIDIVGISIATYPGPSPAKEKKKGLVSTASAYVNYE